MEGDLGGLVRAIRDRRVILLAGAGKSIVVRAAVVADADPAHGG
jgi:hypothetical protein